jgi:xanthine dehydrogenase YagT iron-sulfur-binding subunit
LNVATHADDDQTGAGNANTHADAGVSRRSFIKVGAAALAAEGLLGQVVRAAPATQPAPAGPGGGPVFSGNLPITLRVNGQARPVTVEPRTTLLSALRDRLDPPLTGPKLVCNVATCGACTVLLDDKIVYGCSVLAIDAVGRSVTTVEGLGTPDHLSPVQAAFCEKDAMMCGFCTSGFVTTVTAFLRDHPNPTRQEVQEGCKGNFCRCGTYPHVFDAALAAAKATG